LSEKVVGRLVQPNHQSIKSVEPIPVEKWPIWAKGLRQLSKPEDKGIGDVVARLIGDENSEKFKAWYKTTFGKDCGCTGRQAEWNTKYPLGDSGIAQVRQPS
jgi:hypothetical protein